MSSASASLSENLNGDCENSGPISRELRLRAHARDGNARKTSSARRNTVIRFRRRQHLPRHKHRDIISMLGAQQRLFLGRYLFYQHILIQPRQAAQFFTLTVSPLTPVSHRHYAVTLSAPKAWNLPPTQNVTGSYHDAALC